MPKTQLTGKVVSAKMEKTVVVDVKRFFKHPIYGKTTHTSKKYKAHDEIGAQVGDEVVIEEIAPISKTKRFIVVRKIEDKK